MFLSKICEKKETLIKKSPSLVPGMGVEPTRPKTHAPQACTSTNSVTQV